MSRAVILMVLLAAPAIAEDAAAVRFLDAKEAASAIADETMEPYFSRFQPGEIFAKTGKAPAAKTPAEQREECKKRYQEAVLEFTDDERKAIAAATQSVIDGLKAAYPVFAKTPFVFLKVNDSIEGGMPFTHGPAIVLPASVADAFTGAKDPAKSGLRELLVHEQSHVLQRARPELFEGLYTKVWGFARAKDLASCEWLDRVQVLNPDGPDEGWVFPEKDGEKTTWWQPIVVLREGVKAPRMPDDFQIFACECEKDGSGFKHKLDKDGKPVRKSLSGIAAYDDAFGIVDENFHPNEIFATLFGRLVMQENLLMKKKTTEAELVKVREWCAKNFAERR